MNLDWIRYFTVLAETKSFKEASDKLSITSPALSKSLFELEKYLDTKLIIRTNRFKSLTPAGELLLKRSTGILKSLNNLESEFFDFVSGEPQCIVSIASEAMFQSYLLPKLILEILTEYTKIYPKIYNMLSENIEKNILQGKIDIGLMTYCPKEKGLKFFKGLNIRHSIIAKEKTNKKWDELNYIIPRFFDNKNEVYIDGWNDEKYPRKVIIEVESLDTSIKLCETGIGVSFLPEICLKEQLEKESLFIISEPPFEFFDEIYLVWSSNNIQTKAFYEVLDKIKYLLSKT